MTDPSATGDIVAKWPTIAPLRGFRSAVSNGQEPVSRAFADPMAAPVYSGRTAAYLAVTTLDLPQGARILFPAYHCGSELDAVEAAGAVPVFYALDDALQADITAVERGLADGARAIYAIHFFGFPQPLAALRALADQYGAALIEDVALGLYSTTEDGTPLGTIGDRGIFSFVKTLGVPDGGALTTRQPITVPRLRAAPARQTAAALKSLARNRRRKTLRDEFADLRQADREQLDEGGKLSAHWPLRRPSLPTRFLLRLADHERVAAAHRRNFDALHAATPRTPRLRPLTPPRPYGACPAFFPVYAEDVESLVAALREARTEPVRFWRQEHATSSASAIAGRHPLRTRVVRIPIHENVAEHHVARILEACRSVA